MYKYNPEYSESLNRLYKNINSIADKESTSFEYVVKDLYDIHLHNY